MSVTRANIQSGGKDVYVGKSSITATSAANYQATPGSYDGAKLIFIGSVKDSSIKLNGNPFEETLADGANVQTGVDINFEVEGLETDLVTIATLENFLAYECQIILLPPGVATGSAMKVNAVGLTVGYNGVFTRKNANTFKLSAKRQADKLTSAVSTITIA